MPATDRPARGSARAGLLGILAVAAVAALAYFGAPALHGAGIHTAYQSVVDFITHHQSETAPAASEPEVRHMDPNFESDLRGFIPVGTNVTVTAVSGDQEALAFAQEIAAWLRANGWQHVLDVKEHVPTFQEHIVGTNLRINPKGGMEIMVGPRPESTP